MEDIVPVSKGLEYFNARLVDDPSSSSAYWLRGVCWEQVQEFGLAAMDYEEAVKNNPSNRAAKLGWARTLAAHQKYNEDRFQEAWQEDKSSPRVFLQWGSALVSAKQPHRAAEMFERAIKLNPTWHMPYYSLGKLAADQKKYDEALDQYAEALRRDPSYHAVHRDRALAWLASKEMTFEELQKFLKDPDPAERWLKEHKADQTAVLALTAAHKACDLTSFRESESLAVLAQAFAAFSRWPEARRFQQMAVEYAPFHAKTSHMERYFAYDKLVLGNTLIAANDAPRPATEASKPIGPAKTGASVTESVVRPSTETAADTPLVETLPQPAVKAPGRPLFIDRSALRFP